MNSWMKFVMDSQRCERCGSEGLKMEKRTVDLHWSNDGRDEVPVTISFVPLLVCPSCGQTHTTNAVLEAIRIQFLCGATHEPFDYEWFQARLANLSIEEQWAEENYYFSTDMISDGFEMKVHKTRDENFIQKEEVIYG